MALIRLRLIILITLAAFSVVAQSDSIGKKLKEISLNNRIDFRAKIPAREEALQKTRQINGNEPSALNEIPLSSRSNAETRKILNPLRLFMNKPKISPLYLINGTVCRFVNGHPVCTTLSTTGLASK